jgi:4-hydroxybenzoate polyprenyltransferase
MDIGRIQGVSSTAVIAILGAYTSTGTPSPVDWLKFLIVSALCHFSAASMNEYCDKELDSKVKELSNKPMVKGILTGNEALSFSIFTLFAGIIAAIYFFPKPPALIILLFSGMILFSYDLVGKKIFLWYEVALSIGLSLYVLFGIYAIGEPTPISWIVFIFIFIYSLFGQWENEMKDVDADRILKIPSFAVLSGYTITKKLTLHDPILLYGIAVKVILNIIYLLPFILGMTTGTYLYIFLFIGLPAQTFIIYHLFGEHTRKDFIKIMMIDLAVTWILGTSLVLDKAGYYVFTALVLFSFLGYRIGSSLQRGAEFKFGGAIE